ncbi:MAG: alpha/beta hydrolase [Alphaproteobacteria bacterium]|nr:alpha/beta hydrolase [Alphaproteobacteria bacterium]OJV16114.1 MAG: hypothetical protein BGO27_02635 [Alphaproteobacteria bacterium 33-17]
MLSKFIVGFIITITLTQCSKLVENNQLNPIIQQSYTFVDSSRHREIPIELYFNDYHKHTLKDIKNKIPLVIISHGYGAKNTEYSFIANHLAEKGYFVASIQHDLDSDKPLPRTGDLFKRRMPFWHKGAQNISFVISEFQKMGLGLAYSHIILIGHSNGGDMSMLFAQKYPQMVYKVISLDSLRYPFPVSKNVSILSIRANDTKADPGVLPETGATIIELPEAKHIELSDRGHKEVQAKTLAIIDEFLDKK